MRAYFLLDVQNSGIWPEYLSLEDNNRNIQKLQDEKQP